MRNRDLFPHLHLDCDGVLADFDKKAMEIFGMPSKEFEGKHGSKPFWTTIREYEEDGKGYFESLDLMPDAMTLFNAVKHVGPSILTGAPNGDWAEPQKRIWTGIHFPNVKVTVCLSKDKKLHMKEGDIIIDDTEKHKHLWEDAGGIFILHTSAQDSIAQLKLAEPMFFQNTDMWTPPKGI